MNLETIRHFRNTAAQKVQMIAANTKENALKEKNRDAEIHAFVEEKPKSKMDGKIMIL